MFFLSRLAAMYTVVRRKHFPWAWSISYFISYYRYELEEAAKNLTRSRALPVQVWFNRRKRRVEFCLGDTILATADAWGGCLSGPSCVSFRSCGLSEAERKMLAEKIPAKVVFV